TDKKIVGCIRWIPKLISSTGSKEGKIVYIDNYASTANVQPIPLTTKRLKLFQQKHADTQQADKLTNRDGNDDDGDDDASDLQIATAFGTGHDDEGDEEDIDNLKDYANTVSQNDDSWSIIGRTGEIPDLKYPINKTADANINMPAEHFFNENVGEHRQRAIIERSNSNLEAAAIAAVDLQLQDETKQLKEQIQREQSNMNQEKQSRNKISKENVLLKDLQQKLLRKQAQEQKIKGLMNEIKATDYDNIEPIVAQVFLLSKIKQITNHLKAKYPLDDYFIAIPNIIIAEKDAVYCLSVTGVQAHHDEFKLVLKRIQTLSNVTQSAKVFYQNVLNRIVTSITQIMVKKVPFSHDWQSYTRIFQQLVENKIQDLIKVFDEYITRESRELTDHCITDVHFKSWAQLRILTNRYLQKNAFTSELEALKHIAFEEFIKQKISSQQLKFEKKPSKKSLEILNEFINKIKKEFKQNKQYTGCDLQQFKQILKLLQRTMLYYRCFLLQLPLYESAKELLDKIEKNNVVTVATSTGSGKL
ncbi:unnamed protein product, partial [Rotaria magnacalcarata]